MKKMFSDSVNWLFTWPRMSGLVSHDTFLPCLRWCPLVMHQLLETLEVLALKSHYTQRCLLMKEYWFCSKNRWGRINAELEWVPQTIHPPLQQAWQAEDLVMDTWGTFTPSPCPICLLCSCPATSRLSKALPSRKLYTPFTGTHLRSGSLLPPSSPRQSSGQGRVATKLMIIFW